MYNCVCVPTLRSETTTDGSGNAGCDEAGAGGHDGEPGSEAPLFFAAAPMKDVAVIQNLLDLDQQQKGLSTAAARKAARGKPSSRRRPLSAASAGSNASSVNIRLPQDALLRNRRTYRPATDAGTISAACETGPRTVELGRALRPMKLTLL